MQNSAGFTAATLAMTRQVKVEKEQNLLSRSVLITLLAFTLPDCQITKCFKEHICYQQQTAIKGVMDRQTDGRWGSDHYGLHCLHNIPLHLDSICTQEYNILVITCITNLLRFFYKHLCQK